MARTVEGVDSVCWFEWPGPAVCRHRRRRLDRRSGDVYIVHVKRMGASETRQNWFRILDDVLAGEVVVIERRGRRVVLRAEEPAAGGEPTAPDYSALIGGPVDRADEWSWEWSGPEGDLAPSA